MKTGLLLTAHETNMRLVSAQHHILLEIYKPENMKDPLATQLCAVNAHLDSALKLLQQQPPDGRPSPVLPSGAGDE